MNKLLSYLAIAALLAASDANAACLVTPPDNVNSGSEFMTAVIRALSNFQAAETSFYKIARATQSMDMVSAIDIATEDIQCASDDVQYFKDTSNKDRSSAAGYLQDIASNLIALNKQTKTMLVKQLNGDYADEKPGDHALRMSEQAKQYRTIWGLLPPNASMSFLTLVEFENPQTTKFGRLSITRQEMRELTEKLAADFPAIQKRKMESMSQPEVAAYTLYVGLVEENWPTHDEPFPNRKARPF